MLRRHELAAIEKEQKEQELIRKVEGKRLADLEAELLHIALTWTAHLTGGPSWSFNKLKKSRGALRRQRPTKLPLLAHCWSFACYWE